MEYGAEQRGRVRAGGPLKLWKRRVPNPGFFLGYGMETDEGLEW